MEVVLSDPNCVTLDESRLFDLKLIIRKKDAYFLIPLSREKELAIPHLRKRDVKQRSCLA